MPNLLVAPRNDYGPEGSVNEEDGAGGYWEDETFIAAPQPTPPGPATQLSAAQLRYYESLLAQFRLIQATLRCSPPLEAVQALPPDRPISFPSDSAEAAQRWEKHILSSDPSMVQMACMDMDSVWQLVRTLGEMLIKITRSPQRLGAWAWAVLGRCPELGMCHSEEVGDLRALARTAVALLNVEIIEGDHGSEVESGSDDHSSEIGRHVDTNWAPRETALDMMITIVGEVYGQRDLLEQRRIWQQADS